jgi:hypothetical protein
VYFCCWSSPGQSFSGQISVGLKAQSHPLKAVLCETNRRKLIDDLGCHANDYLLLR